MSSRLVQVRSADGVRMVGITRGGQTHRVKDAISIYALAQQAIRTHVSLERLLNQLGIAEPLNLTELLMRKQILAPIDHSDSAHLWLTGTGLTHLGSADARDRMHAKAHSADASDSMKMFRMGLEGGKASGAGPGVQPEWFYKGDGHSLVAPGAPLTSPPFALNGGEEPELAGIYLIGADGRPFRLGFALANEFSDHIMERQNYLYLAHSKLRPASIGPELLLGELPTNIHGKARIWRGGQALWEKAFLTGEDNMSHHIHNLEHHHFKYELFRRPGDVHVHFFGTATLSFSDGVIAQDGDVFEIEAAPFGLPLRNPLRIAPAAAVEVQSL
jgi:hypothetical protein